MVSKEFKKELKGSSILGYKQIYEKEKKIGKKRIKKVVKGASSLKGKSPSPKLSSTLMKSFKPQKQDQNQLAAMKLAHQQKMEYLKEVQRMRKAEAEQLAYQQDPRFQSGPEDSFLSEQDQIHERNVVMSQQQPQFQEQVQQQSNGPSIAKRFINGLGNLGNVMGRQRPQVYVDEYGRQVAIPKQVQQRVINPTQKGIVREPKLTTVHDKATLLKVGNIFNKPDNNSLLGRRR